MSFFFLQVNNQSGAEKVPKDKKDGKVKKELGLKAKEKLKRKKAISSNVETGSGRLTDQVIKRIKVENGVETTTMVKKKKKLQGKKTKDGVGVGIKDNVKSKSFYFY